MTPAVFVLTFSLVFPNGPRSAPSSVAEFATEALCQAAAKVWARDHPNPPGAHYETACAARQSNAEGR